MTPITPRFLRALEYCKLWHGEQKRKYTGEPYYLHPLEVAEILARIDVDEDILIAGLFHDVFEDTKTLPEDVAFLFGGRIVDLVIEVTDVSKPEDGNRETRKQLDLEHIAGASEAGKTIKLADLISNTHSIVKYDPDFAVQYLREKTNLLGVLEDGHPRLLAMAHRMVSQGLAELKQKGKI